MIEVRGRKGVFNPNRAAVEVRRTATGISIRVDDDESPEFWMEIDVDAVDIPPVTQVDGVNTHG